MPDEHSLHNLDGDDLLFSLLEISDTIRELHMMVGAINRTHACCCKTLVGLGVRHVDGRMA